MPLNLRNGALVAALLLAGCSGEEKEQELVCPEDMHKVERHNLTHCVLIHPEVMTQAGTRSPQDDRSADNTNPPDVPGDDRGEGKPKLTSLEVLARHGGDLQASGEVSNENEKRVIGLIKNPLELKSTNEEDVDEISLYRKDIESSIRQILEEYDHALGGISQDRELRQLSNKALQEIMYSHLKKVNFNDVDKSLSNLDEVQVMPWEMEEDDELFDEVNERTIEVEVKKGDSFLGVLAREGISTGFFYQLSKTDQRRLTSLSVGDKLKIVEEGGVLHSLAREISSLKTLIIERVGDEYALSEVLTDPDTRLKRYHFDLNTSLYIDGTRAGVSDNAISNLQRIFGERINFSRDIQKGDQFTLILEEPVLDGEVVGRPTIVGAKITRIRGKDIYALRYQDKSGSVRYYDEDGGSLQAGFIRKPVSHHRISSHYNPSRKHPVTGKVRPHLGTDFASPTGTPIYAASDGRVTRAGWASGYGNVVYIDHGNGIQTRYAHMSRFDTRRGRHVRQGEVIGYVGMTGTATGPHLHYEYRINGKAVDPMKVDLPTASAVSSVEIDRFKSQVQEVLKKIRE